MIKWLMIYSKPFISLIVILVLIAFFRKRQLLPLKSTHIFTSFLLLCFFNVIFEMFTYFTIERISDFPKLNRFSHQLFIASLNCIIYSLFLYICTKANYHFKKNVLLQILNIIPLLVSFFVIIFGKLEFNTNSSVRYSYGPMVVTVYLCSLIYIILIDFILIFRKKEFPKSTNTMIIIGLLIWSIAIILQFIHPTMLLSSQAIMILVIFLFLSSENPREYTDYSIKKLLNTRAFNLVLQDYFNSGKNFFIINFTIKESNCFEYTLGYNNIEATLRLLIDEILKVQKVEIYKTKENTLSIFLKNKNDISLFKNNFNRNIKLKDENSITIIPEILISVFEYPKNIKNQNDIISLLNFINTDGLSYQTNEIIEINDNFLTEMNKIATIEQLVHSAIEQDGFDVVYQPIYSTTEKKFISAEALVRLKDTTTVGFVSPEVFIPIAEKHGLIKELGIIVFDKVCEFAKKENLVSKGIKYIEVNLSAIQVVDEELPDLLIKTVEKYDLNPNFINLEITETASVSAGNMLKKNVKKLHNLGFSFSMDDFGTGYSNLAQIIEANFDLIKIDKSLIWPCFDNSKDNKEATTLLVKCIELIQALNFEIVAEGIETKEMVDFLEQNKITYLQGYYYSKPLSQKDFIDFLDNNSAK